MIVVVRKSISWVVDENSVMSSHVSGFYFFTTRFLPNLLQLIVQDTYCVPNIML